MKRTPPRASAAVLSAALTFTLHFAAAPAAAMDACALPGVHVASEDGVGGTGLSGDDEGLGGTGHSGDGLGGTGFASSDGIGGTGVSGDEDGIGGTGHSGDDDGVGGTGFANADGIGGTGLSDDDGVGGTGIWGTITNFGSICVNGLRVQYDDETKILRNGELTEAAALQRGQVVWVEATARTSGLMANHIAAVSAAVGRLSGLDTATRRFTVGKQTVWVPEGIVWAGLPETSSAKFAALQPGDTVDVSGLRGDDGTIVATRIVRSDKAQPDYQGPRLDALVRESPRVKQLSVEGFRDQQDPGTTSRVSGIAVEGSRLRKLAPASRVWVSGPRSGAVRMDARKVLYRPLQRAPSRAARAEDAQLWQEQVSETEAPQVIETGTPPVAETPGSDIAPVTGDSRVLPVAVKPSQAPTDRTSGSVTKPASPTRASPNERPQAIERPQKPQRIDRPIKVDRPVRIERPERIERPVRIERPTAIK